MQLQALPQSGVPKNQKEDTVLLVLTLRLHRRLDTHIVLSLHALGVMQYDGEEDGPPSTRLGYVSLDQYIRTLRSQIKERSAEVTSAEEDVSRLQQICKVPHTTLPDNASGCHQLKCRSTLTFVSRPEMSAPASEICPRWTRHKRIFCA